jgi:hypothetical protein
MWRKKAMRDKVKNPFLPEVANLLGDPYQQVKTLKTYSG